MNICFVNYVLNFVVRKTSSILCTIITDGHGGAGEDGGARVYDDVDGGGGALACHRQYTTMLMPVSLDHDNDLVLLRSNATAYRAR